MQKEREREKKAVLFVNMTILIIFVAIIIFLLLSLILPTSLFLSPSHHAMYPTPAGPPSDHHHRSPPAHPGDAAQHMHAAPPCHAVLHDVIVATHAVLPELAEHCGLQGGGFQVRAHAHADGVAGN